VIGIADAIRVVRGEVLHNRAAILLAMQVTA
jgi:hypothetical protein